MSWFERTKPVDIVTDAEGLARLFCTLHRQQGLASYAHGVSLRVYTSSGERFLVYLTREQTKTLLDLMPTTTLQDRYGVSD